MKVVHLADTHLGFRQFHRSTPRGINQREADVAATFSRAIDQTIAIAPSLVIIGGDLFHSVQSSNLAIVHAYREFARLRAALAPHGGEVVVVAGNHDTPRSASMGCILRLFSGIGVHVVDGAAESFDFPHLNCSVLGIADASHERPALVPTGNRKYNVMVIHGETGGVTPRGTLLGTWAEDHEITPEDMNAAAWDYIGFGHYHVYREIAPNCFYSGSIDYTSSDPWGEVREQVEKNIPGKGIVERDLESGAHTFHPLPGLRRFIDLPTFSALDYGVETLNAAIANAVASCPGGIADAVVRLVITDVERETARNIDHKAMRQHKAAALNFSLEMERPTLKRAGNAGALAAATAGSASFRVRRPLSESLEIALRMRPLPDNVSREEFVALGLRYLVEAERKAATTVVETSEAIA